jgi:5-formyltetrahydrofolate cyclo-ligase
MESLAVAEQLRHIIARRAPKVVALFAPLWDEVQLQGLIDCLSCRVVLPRVEGDDMEFFDYTPTDLKEGSFGIMEPQGRSMCSADEIDLMVLPGVAFSPSGVRLGRGKGYYDRYLARDGFRAFTIGVCYACQRRESLPREEYDRVVEMVIFGE